MQYVGFAFQPYVGPWQPSSNPTAADAWSAYSQSVVQSLMQALQDQFISQVSTYGAGWGAYGAPPVQSDANQFILPCAKSLGMTVVAGANQWLDSLHASGWNLQVTKNDIDTTLSFAQQNPGVVTALNITNEAVEAGTKTSDEKKFAQNVLLLVEYAIGQLSTYGFQNSDPSKSNYLPVTIRESAGILNGVNQNQTYSSTLKTTLSKVNFVYANIYPYGFTYNLGASPTKKEFQDFITTQLTASINTLEQNFSGQQLSTPIAIGETGWPTAGVNKTTSSLPTSVQLAQWNYQAVYKWANANQRQTFLFEAFDEPFKTGAPGAPPNAPTFAGSDQGYFGVFKADGHVPSADWPYNQAGNYTLKSVSQMYNYHTLGPGSLVP